MYFLTQSSLKLLNSGTVVRPILHMHLKRFRSCPKSPSSSAQSELEREGVFLRVRCELG